MNQIREYARAILIDDQQRLIVFKRTKPNVDVYWATAGGQIEAGESVEAALKRELFEELNAQVDRLRQVFLYNEDFGYKTRIHHLFVCRLVAMDELSPPTGPEFSTWGHTYAVDKIDLAGDALGDINLKPDELKTFILANKAVLLSLAGH